MEDNFEFKQCSENDVIEFSSGTYRVQKLIETIPKIFLNVLAPQLYERLQKAKISIPVKNSSYSNYFTKGVDCEILKVGGDAWQKGKLKINVSIEFIPDEPETSPSELDSVRQEISN